MQPEAADGFAKHEQRRDIAMPGIRRARSFDGRHLAYISDFMEAECQNIS